MLYMFLGLWLVLSLGVIGQYVRTLGEVGLMQGFIFFVLMVLTAPFIVVNNIVFLVLDAIMPEGWDDEEP